jgi:hypothetical protein
MADMLSAGIAHLATRIKEAASIIVICRRGNATIADLKATVGTSLLKITTPQGAVKIVRTDRDFIFAAADYDFGAGVVEPARSDTFDELWPDGVTRRYQVVSPGGDEPSWRYSDRYRIMVRAHTKYVGVV